MRLLSTCACTMLNVDSLSTNWIAKSLHIVSGDINTILFTQNVREPKWLPTFHLTGAIFSLRELWLPCSRVFVFTAMYRVIGVSLKSLSSTISELRLSAFCCARHYFSLHKLHTTYCMSLYGCEIWNYNSRYIDEMFIAWRKIMRKLFKLPNRTHNYIVCGIIEFISIKLDRRLAKFVYSMLNSRNLTVFKLIRLFLQSDSSTFAENVRYLMYKYEIPIFVWERDFSDVIKYVHNKQVISPIQLSEVDSVKELCKMRDGVLFSDLSKRDIQILIDVICIS